VQFQAAPGVNPAEISRILSSPHPEQHLRQVRTVDAGRRNRNSDRFMLRLPGGPTRLVLRVAAPEPTELAISVNGSKQGPIHISAGPWQEPSLELAPLPGQGRVRVEIRASEPATFASYHYWAYAPRH
jgi:hypothetical protein